ncbi:serine hydroxymethyltransferase, partial [Candidatus Peregrinibacteria bacterium]|nr:serine hydroxymethyltransferase [Candidatus Peregrinibacteria bacterium]
MILTRTAELGQKIDKAVFPGFQGGPIMQMIAAKAVAFGEALKPEFRAYAQQIVRNAAHLAAFLMNRGVKLVTNGTSNHLLLIDCIRSWNLSGGEVEKILDRVNITTNKNMIPDDPRKPMDPSGLRIGTPAITTRGMRETDMETLGSFILSAIEHRSDTNICKKLREEVTEFCRNFPVPGIATKSIS